jgi:hypothetical protein
MREQGRVGEERNDIYFSLREKEKKIKNGGERGMGR